ncbi:hypothetical protein HDU67_004811 [Dinochytrium kinnereticum]|nr:hypothetical protein HDU67_004811 [Dinochytrium kinnereticum]
MHLCDSTAKSLLTSHHLTSPCIPFLPPSSKPPVRIVRNDEHHPALKQGQQSQKRRGGEASTVFIMEGWGEAWRRRGGGEETEEGRRGRGWRREEVEERRGRHDGVQDEDMLNEAVRNRDTGRGEDGRKEARRHGDVHDHGESRFEGAHQVKHYDADEEIQQESRRDKDNEGSANGSHGQAADDRTSDTDSTITPPNESVSAAFGNFRGVSTSQLKGEMALPKEMLVERIVRLRRDLSRERRSAENRLKFLETEVEILRRGYSVRSYLDDGGRTVVSPAAVIGSPHARSNVLSPSKYHGPPTSPTKSCLRPRPKRSVSFDNRSYIRVLPSPPPLDGIQESDSDDPPHRHRSHSAPQQQPTMAQLGAAARRETALLTAALEAERENRSRIETELRIYQGDITRLNDAVGREKNRVKEAAKEVQNLTERLLNREKEIQEERKGKERLEGITRELRDELGETVREVRDVRGKLGEAYEEVDEMKDVLKRWRGSCEQDVLDMKELCVNPHGLADAVDKELMKRKPEEFFSSTDTKVLRKMFREICVGVLNLAAFKISLESSYTVDIETECSGYETLSKVILSRESRNPEVKTRVVPTKLDALVTFSKKKKSDRPLKTVAICFDVVLPGCWFERFFTPTSPHNHRPFTNTKPSPQNPNPPGRALHHSPHPPPPPAARPPPPEDIRAPNSPTAPSPDTPPLPPSTIFSQHYRKHFRDTTKTVSVLPTAKFEASSKSLTGLQKSQTRHMTLKELLKMRGAKMRKFRFDPTDAEGRCPSQGVVIILVVGGCVAEEVWGEERC